MRGGREALLFHEMGAGFIRHLGDGAQGRRPRIGHKAEIGGLPRPKGGGEKEINQDGNEENGETPSIVPALQQSIDGNALSHAEPISRRAPSSRIASRMSAASSTHWTVTAPFQFCLSCIRARFAGRMPSLLSGFFLSMGGIVQDDAAMSFKKRRSVLKGGGIL